MLDVSRAHRRRARTKGCGEAEGDTDTQRGVCTEACTCTLGYKRAAQIDIINPRNNAWEPLIERFDGAIMVERRSPGDDRHTQVTISGRDQLLLNLKPSMVRRVSWFVPFILTGLTFEQDLVVTSSDAQTADVSKYRVVNLCNQTLELEFKSSLPEPLVTQVEPTGSKWEHIDKWVADATVGGSRDGIRRQVRWPRGGDGGPVLARSLRDGPLAHCSPPCLSIAESVAASSSFLEWMRKPSGSNPSRHVHPPLPSRAHVRRTVAPDPLCREVPDALMRVCYHADISVVERSGAAATPMPPTPLWECDRLGVAQMWHSMPRTPQASSDSTLAESLRPRACHLALARPSEDLCVWKVRRDRHAFATRAHA